MPSHTLRLCRLAQSRGRRVCGCNGARIGELIGLVLLLFAIERWLATAPRRSRAA